MSNNSKPEAPPVGYKRPPVAHQFKKGQSGNPKGRPKKSKSKRDILSRVLGEKQRLNGQPRGARVWFTWLELLIMALKNRAISGHVRASRLFDEMSGRFGDEEPQKDLKHGFLIVPEKLTEEEWEARYSPKDTKLGEADG